jgi:hypothetical protein
MSMTGSRSDAELAANGRSVLIVTTSSRQRVKPQTRHLCPNAVGQPPGMDGAVIVDQLQPGRIGHRLPERHRILAGEVADHVGG